MSGKIIHYDEIDSTNTEAKRLAKDGTAHGTVVAAESQTAGRGRLGRSWNSPAGSSIYMTEILRPELEPNRASMLTLVMACAVADAIRECTDLDAQIKWPNDIVVGGKKVCGILTEMSAEVDHIHYVVIGVGINVNTESFPKELAKMATSLCIEAGQTFSREIILNMVLKNFEKDYAIFMEKKDLSDLQARYNQLLVNRGKEVRILGASESYCAIAGGINRRGELLIRKEDGTEEAIFAGEVSVRGIYGYV